jgi:hypothetical protein
MHETLISNVVGFIDKHTDEVIEGWAFHLEQSCLPLRVKCGQLFQIINTIDRPDVAKFYKKDNMESINYGFQISYNKNLLKELDNSNNIYLEILLEKVWIPFFILSNTDLKTELKNEKVEERVDLQISESVFYPLIVSSINEKKIPSFIVIDNIYSEPDKVREFALKQNFISHEQWHKGKRTDECFLFDGLKEAFENYIGTTIPHWAKHGTNGCFQYCIGGDQLVYHYDGQQYAGILFLTPDAPPMSGTSFYRSKYTKNMKVFNDDNIVFQNGFLDPTGFDVVDVVGNVYNRLVIFDAKLIHAASCYFGTNKENSRLFQLFFFDL